MNKNIQMLKCYLNVLKNDIETTRKVIPNMYAKNFYDIDFSFLKKIGIKYLLIDIDGTILPVDDTNVPDKLVNKIIELKKDFNMCLMSNNDENRILPVSNILNIPFLANSKKPNHIAYDNILKLLSINNLKECSMIGDQMLSDIYGANDYGIYSILVNPIDKKQNIKTGTQRILQNSMEKHLKKLNLFDNKKYYKTPIK